jgi:trans-2,3-dihydro-3-hydroxyanthranilate isomerase
VRTYRFVQVDVFGSRPFAGNPLAVFYDAAGLSDQEMQSIARETNLSETTFVTPPETGGDIRVRIFTPGVELPFAGHPSVGTACAAVRLELVPMREPVTDVTLELNVGPTLVEVQVQDGQPLSGVVHQGAPRFGSPIPRDEAAAVLRLTAGDLHPDLHPQVVGTGLDYAIVPLRDTEALARAWFDLELLPGFEQRYAGLYVFAMAGTDGRYAEARCFAPLEGIPEDPATGSAAGPLSAYLVANDLLALGQERVIDQGAHAGRPSELTVCVLGDGSAITDVTVGGGVVPMMSGELTF